MGATHRRKPGLLGSESSCPPNVGGFESNMGPSVANLHPGRRPLSRKPVSLETIGLSCSLRERSEYRGSLPSAPFFCNS